MQRSSLTLEERYLVLSSPLRVSVDLLPEVAAGVVWLARSRSCSPSEVVSDAASLAVAREHVAVRRRRVRRVEELVREAEEWDPLTQLLAKAT
jgi:hypothetical protein